MAASKELTSPKAKKGSGGMAVSLLILTVLGGAAGAAFKMLSGDMPTAGDAGSAEGQRQLESAENTAIGSDKKLAKTDFGEFHSAPHMSENTNGSAEQSSPTVIRLDPIITSLDEQTRVWIRLEGSVVFVRQPEEGFDIVSKQIAADALAYLRTIKLVHVSGPPGFEFLADDLTDIARVRSNGAADSFLITGLIFE